jgi:hypothetical protein
MYPASDSVVATRIARVDRRAVERVDGRLSAEALDQIWICDVEFTKSGSIGFAGGYDGEVLDDAELRARNERAFERMQLEKQRAIEMQQIEAENERLRLLRDQTALAYAATPTWASTYDGWFFVGRHRGRPARLGVSPRMGGSRR